MLSLLIMNNVSLTNSSTPSQTPPTVVPPRLYVADTVALILRLEKRAMGGNARQVFLAVGQGQAKLLLPAMVFAELMYLVGRKRITATLSDVEVYLSTYPACREAPLTLAIVKAAQTITDISELHDRLIAATAIHYKAVLLTNDMTISASTHLQTLW